MQAQPALAWTEAALAVAWVDYRERDWQVWAVVMPEERAAGALSKKVSNCWTSLCRSLPEGARAFRAVPRTQEGAGSAVRVSPPSETEVLAADPVLTEGPGGTLVLAWEDLRARRG